MLLAIVFPSIGAARGLLAIIRHSALCKDPIKRALRSRAMCMVVRSKEWRPSSRQKVYSLSVFVRDVAGKGRSLKRMKIFGCRILFVSQ